MNTAKLCDFDANLYRLYAVGLLGYDDALSQAKSDFHLRRALLAFDQSSRPSGPPVTPSASVFSTPAASASPAQ